MRHPLRLVQSTGDIVNNSLRARLPAFAITEGRTELSQEDGLFRIGKYTLDERRLRILRYRQKRQERNFDRKIKYACRKTLADSRPRVRGRFAKNEGPEAAGAAGAPFEDEAFDLNSADLDDVLKDALHSGGGDGSGLSGTSRQR
jgi:CCT motif